VATTPTSRQDDISHALDRLSEAAKLVHVSSKRKLPRDPHESPVFPIPDYMNPPQTFVIYDHYIRVWRALAIELTKQDFRRCIGLLEFTPLKEENGLSLGLEWFYSAHQFIHWSDYQYILYSHYPGAQPCRDLVDVYHSCSLEIRWVIIGLQGREGLQQYRLQHKNKNDCHETKQIRDAETGEQIA